MANQTYDIQIKQEDGTMTDYPIHVDAVTSPTDADTVKKVGQVRENNGALEYALNDAPDTWKTIGGGGGGVADAVKDQDITNPDPIKIDSSIVIPSMGQKIRYVAFFDELANKITQVSVDDLAISGGDSSVIRTYDYYPFYEEKVEIPSRNTKTIDFSLPSDIRFDKIIDIGVEIPSMTNTLKFGLHPTIFNDYVRSSRIELRENVFAELQMAKNSEGQLTISRIVIINETETNFLYQKTNSKAGSLLIQINYFR